MSAAGDLSRLPRIDGLLEAAGALVARFGREPTADALRRAVDAARDKLRAGETNVPDSAALVDAAARDLAARRPGPPKRVINAAGVIVHTNLGRAPLPLAALDAMIAAAGYCDLEYDLARGRRGSRGARLEPLLSAACNAQAGIAVNNAAGALVLSLAALADQREVLVSRGELIEIGGSFRLPDIMTASGARLVEVGTTNRTRLSDYHAGEDVALILQVHPSNYRISGFHEAPSTEELAALAHERGVPLLHDVGSGLLRARREPWLADEPSVHGSLDAGSDLVICSGDKLLGGPQAGLLVGNADLVAACRRHPLARALRLDKLRIAALVATLEAHLRGDLGTLPVWAALLADTGSLRSRCERLAERIGGELCNGVSLVGGGSAPGHEIPTPLVRLPLADAEAAAARLRGGDPAIVARVEDRGLVLDLRAIDPSDDEPLAAAVRNATAG